jgi:hypothetical protein
MDITKTAQEYFSVGDFVWLPSPKDNKVKRIRLVEGVIPSNAVILRIISFTRSDEEDALHHDSPTRFDALGLQYVRARDVPLLGGSSVVLHRFDLLFKSRARPC